jgi:hypothetical protein
VFIKHTLENSGGERKASEVTPDFTLLLLHFLLPFPLALNCFSV